MPARRSPDPVFAAIATHREALAEFSGELHYFSKKRSGWDMKPEFRSAKEAYLAKTTVLVNAEITTRAGLQAFIAYVEELDAHRLPVSWYGAIWHHHLSDALATISDALRRLHPPRRRAPRAPSLVAAAASAVATVH